jgi:hypothetical protein
VTVRLPCDYGTRRRSPALVVTEGKLQAPIGAGMVSGRGLTVVMTEALQFAPLLVWAVWPRRRT